MCTPGPGPPVPPPGQTGPSPRHYHPPEMQGVSTDASLRNREGSVKLRLWPGLKEAQAKQRKDGAIFNHMPPSPINPVREGCSFRALSILWAGSETTVSNSSSCINRTFHEKQKTYTERTYTQHFRRPTAPGGGVSPRHLADGEMRCQQIKQLEEGHQTREREPAPQFRSVSPRRSQPVRTRVPSRRLLPRSHLSLTLRSQDHHGENGKGAN